MKITVTAKTRFYPDVEQEQLLRETVRRFVACCNSISRWSFENKTTDMRKLNDALYHSMKDEFGLGAQLTQSALRKVIATYKAIHAHHQRWSTQPTFTKHTMDLVWNRNYSITRDDKFSISTMSGRVKCDVAWNGPVSEYFGGEFGTANVTNRHGKWFLHIPVTYEIDDPETPQNVVGVDLGINFLATAHDSSGKTSFYSGREVKHRRGRYKNLRKELQSKKTRSARKRLRKIGSRENRWMTDVNHRISKALVTSTDTPSLFVLEDLSGIRKATERVSQRNRYVQVSWAFSQLRRFIEYKAPMYGHSAVAVDPRYTSQMCPKCGHVERKNRQQRKHLFVCRNCGYTSNDDRVAGMNLRLKGIQYLAQSGIDMIESGEAESTVSDVPSIQGKAATASLTGQEQISPSKVKC